MILNVNIAQCLQGLISQDKIDKQFDKAITFIQSFFLIVNSTSTIEPEMLPLFLPYNPGKLYVDDFKFWYNLLTKEEVIKHSLKNM